MDTNRTRRRVGFISSKLSKEQLLKILKDEKRVNQGITKEKIENTNIPKFLKSF